MKDITKLEVFAAYLPYQVRFTFQNWLSDGDADGDLLDKIIIKYFDADVIEDEMLLKLRPLSALQTPMLHPVTGERIENPLTWITTQMVISIGRRYYNGDVEDILSGNRNCWITTARLIDRLALSLHFDIFGAIEKGWAVQI